MIAELISVGTELLLGNILNSNAKYLSEQCASLGLSVFYQTVVGDNEERLEDLIRLALTRSDILILTGGLGPTQDDLTKEVVAKAFGYPLVKHQPTEDKLINFFASRKIKMANNNLKQALIPEGAQVLENNNGTAPGLIVAKGEKYAILLPGPPKEMIPLFEDCVRPFIREKNPEVIYSRVLKVMGIGESNVEEMLIDLIERQTNPTIAPYDKDGEVHLRLTSKASNEEMALRAIQPIAEEIKKRLGHHLYTENEKENIEDVLVGLLEEKQLTLSIAESCTGGLLSGRFINASGASKVFNEGIITYSNHAKMKELGVKEVTLQQYGAVSKQVAEEMAKGMAKKAQSDVALSVTGIAGPTGGTKEKPVGLVYIGCYLQGEVTVKGYQFSGEREKIRNNSVMAALNMLRVALVQA